MPHKKSSRVYNKSIKNTKDIDAICKSIDMFGESVNFSVKGEESFKTASGAFLTMFMLVLFLAYALLKF